MGGLLNRFSGPENRERLLEAVRLQTMIANDEELAERIVAAGRLQELTPGEVIISQGDWDDDVFFILAGRLRIAINGRPQAFREAGTHVGELTGTSPARARTATVSSEDESLVLRIRNADIRAIADDNPAVLRRMLDVVASRLDERNRAIGKTNDVPRVFVISSAERLNVAEEIARQLDTKEIAVDLWNSGTFGLSEYPISSLMDAIEAADFTIAVVGADDLLIMRGEAHAVARDNVHLEYGISLGVLGRRRSLLLVCADDGVHLPSDAAGLTTLRYRHANEAEMKRTVRNACLEAKEHILQEGVFTDRRAR
ncbi:MAG: nucleotide-binding protein [Xanthobacteraceae bacterium]|nr:nucleotide-binding protein [Xanthobacteraceae bacterium]